MEDTGQVEEAFIAYQKLYQEERKDYSIWKNFYFFLWMMIEDAPGSFREKVELQSLMRKMYDEGKTQFSENADYNFIAGYTVSIFPYAFGDYAKFEREGMDMLLKV